MYQALYRKWRPRSFDDVVGQAHITDTLKNQVSTDRLSHAYLFIGTRGTGKTTCAKILAKAVNCENPVDGNPCNVCRICRGIDDGSIMDVVEMDAASNNGVDSVRALRDEAVFSPATARKRVYIIDEVHMLSTSAFNALLKILEEPPEHLMFILATTELNKVPATILSRCQRHSFKRLDSLSIRKRLEYVASREGLDLSSDAAALIAGLSEGGMRDALSILDQCSGRERIDTETVYSAMGLAGNLQICNMAKFIAAGDVSAALQLFQELWRGGKDPSVLLGELSSLMRDLLMLDVAPKGGREILSGSFDEGLLTSLKSLFSADILVSHIALLQDALTSVRQGQARVKSELCLIRLCRPELGDSVAVLRQRIARLEAAVAGGVPVASPASPKIYASPAPVREPEASSTVDLPPFDISQPSTSSAPAPFVPNEPRLSPPPPAEAHPVLEERPPVEDASQNVADGDWDSLCKALSGKVQRGIYTILTDPAQVSGSIDGDTVTLTLHSDFAMMQINRPDLLGSLAAQCGTILGHPVKISTGAPKSGGEVRKSGSKLDELSRFDFVQFK